VRTRYLLAEQNHPLPGKRGAVALIPSYPESAELTLDLRPALHPQFQKLPDGVSEFTFANLYLFRQDHHYRVSKLPDDRLVFTGKDGATPFFMLPFDLPERPVLDQLFNAFGFLKCAPQPVAEKLASMGYTIFEDRDNFDYLYSHQSLAELTGRKFHKKRNLIKAFLKNYTYTGEPLLESHIPAALQVLEEWAAGREDPGDYTAAKEALEKADPLQLCGGIYFVEDRPVAYSLGEENARGKSFIVHFEKAVGGYKGVWQFVNQAFAAILPEQYVTVNREQDLGNEGLRRAKHSYKPIGYVKKYRVHA
jgi:hypothetical protein